METEHDCSFEHHYTSTACQHLLHGRCRKECKFCKALCECSCHQWAHVDTSGHTVP